MPYIQTDDIETYYEKRGDGPPLVLIHGAILDHIHWTPQLEELSDEYTVIAYDVRGHGRTGGSDKKPYSIDLFADDLDALITELELEKPVICGLSTGGCIAQTYAARYTNRLSGLILSDTFTPKPLNRREKFQRYMLKSTIIPARIFGYKRVEKVMVWFQERLNPGVSGDYERINELRKEGPKMKTGEFAKVIRALASFHKTEIELSSIEVPTLVLYGENEPPFLRRHVPKLESEIPNSSTREVPDAGHASNLDNPGFFNDSVREFLKQIDLSSSGTEPGFGSDIGTETDSEPDSETGSESEEVSDKTRETTAS